MEELDNNVTHCGMNSCLLSQGVLSPWDNSNHDSNVRLQFERQHFAISFQYAAPVLQDVITRFTFEIKLNHSANTHGKERLLEYLEYVLKIVILQNDTYNIIQLCNWVELQLSLKIGKRPQFWHGNDFNICQSYMGPTWPHNLLEGKSIPGWLRFGWLNR